MATFNIGQILMAIVLALAVGSFFGFFIRSFFNQVEKNNFFGNFVLIVVTIVWTISMAVDIIDKDYQTSAFVHGLMGAIVGFFYKPLNISSQNSSNEKKE